MVSTPSDIGVDVEARKQNDNANLNLRVLIYDFSAAEYVAMPGIMPLTSSDTVQSFGLPGGADPRSVPFQSTRP